MADITTPQIVVWSNTRARSLADKLASLYPVLVAYQTDWAAQGINAALVTAGATGNVADGSYAINGSVGDGRSIITGTTLQNFIATINQIKAAFDATVTGVGSAATVTVNQIQVNGSPR